MIVKGAVWVHQKNKKAKSTSRRRKQNPITDNLGYFDPSIYKFKKPDYNYEQE